MGYLLLNRKSDKQFSPQQEVAECFPKGISALLCLRLGQQNSGQYPAGY
jgi:hypothetical protein